MIAPLSAFIIAQSKRIPPGTLPATSIDTFLGQDVQHAEIRLTSAALMRTVASRPPGDITPEKVDNKHNRSQSDVQSQPSLSPRLPQHSLSTPGYTKTVVSLYTVPALSGTYAPLIGMRAGESLTHEQGTSEHSTDSCTAVARPIPTVCRTAARSISYLMCQNELIDHFLLLLEWDKIAGIAA